MCYYKIKELGGMNLEADELDALLYASMMQNKHASLAALFGECADNLSELMAQPSDEDCSEIAH